MDVRSLVLVTVGIIAVTLSTGVVGQSEMNLVILQSAVNSGAVCLDGSAPGYYIARAQTNQSSNKWVLFFQGGGWCYTPEDCLSRAGTSLGSSKYWAAAASFGGVLSGDASVNPDFYDWNRVNFNYCDGASFSGNGEQLVGSTTVYYRGHKILHALMKDMLALGADKATDVLISGCSAGGLSVFLHADEMAELLPAAATVKAMPGSGYFMDVKNINGQAVYPDQMHNVFYFQNCIGGVDRDCVRHSPLNPHNCMFAPHTYQYVSTPVMILNSFDDSWQMGNIFGVDVPSFTPSCANQGPNNCTQQQIDQVTRDFARKMVADVTKSPTFSQPGNAVYLSSCWSHCAEAGSGWNSYIVNGVTMQQAVSSWYFAKQSTSPYIIDCYLSAPSNCNPSCA